VEKILHKELNHVAVRHLRDAEDVSTVVDQIPTTLDGYITSGREGGGGIMEAYDELYKQINATLAAKLPVWSKARFTKGELKKALESKGYAAEYYPAVEDYKGASLFETALQLGVAAAKRKGLDPTIFERWADTRNTKTFTPGDEEDDDSLDLDSLTDALIDSDKGEGEQPPPLRRTPSRSATRLLPPNYRGGCSSRAAPTLLDSVCYCIISPPTPAPRFARLKESLRDEL
jgi:hypothetical protein